MIRHVLPVLMLCLAAQGQNLVSTAQSPYELAKFVGTHSDFEWQPLWQKPGINNPDIHLPLCEANRFGPACLGKAIPVPDSPLIIVLLEHEDFMSQVYLRYQNTAPGGWRFAGAYAPTAKYFRPEYRISHLGKKPFLIISEQGESGTGLSTKVEEWIDLTTKNFEPVLGFTSAGTKMPWADGIGRNAGGTVVALETKPVDRITVAFHIAFTTGRDNGDSVPLGSRNDRVVYVRTTKGDFEIDPRRSTASAQVVEKIYNDLDSDLTSQEFLNFNFNGLTAIATGNNATGRQWLLRFLRNSPDTPESRRLKTLLASHR